LALKLVHKAEKSWRRIPGVERIDELPAGTVSKYGVPALEDDDRQQRLDA
jgi:hypothetical protein